ncbi:Non-reducing end beta-L-arabinofuranosidase [Ensifer psoraleae]|uniref:glycoside hydrolase family 127 protein n=1 Tax=Sinorhizobium psoraleae TaxID=520838 RepID=UPI001568D223|nr:glycoside hydrolase family 127 protein [Sinorhizobium psoraleae]NRP75822.1 Non-reducing end beta-L-arabinofuranosidase [Sinorhizobium psoraleae]
MTNFTKMTQFRPLPVSGVTLGGYLGERQDAICNSTAAVLLDRCVEVGMIDRIDVSVEAPLFHGHPATAEMFWDSDFGKSIETIAYSLYRRPNLELEARADRIIDLYEKLQQPDGYLNSWFQRVQPGKRWTNLRDTHELYCAGHLIEGAVAYYQATGKRKFLDIMCRYADYLAILFGRGPEQIRGYCGHEEIELALVKLARVTEERKYLDLAKYFIDERGQQPHFFDLEAQRTDRDPAVYEYNQSHQPVREQKKVVGHAVRAMYLYSGMADIATEFNDDSLTAALETLWDDLTTKQIYVTGGVGPAASNEGFTDHYDLPNDTAYAETCASVGLVFWASRMLGRGPNRRYADIMEQALYNGALPGLSIDGRTFFYDNPLESTGKHHRWNWHPCPCCPPNIARLVASIGSYMYAVAEDEIAVHLYGESVARLKLANGAEFELRQETNYPWEGAIAFTTRLARSARFSLSLRVPEWAEDATLSVNGTMVDLSAVVSDGYARIEREWADGDRVDLELPLELRPQYANPKIRQDAGRVALMRGPIVYCVEETDNGEDLNAIVLPRELPGAEAVVLEDLKDAVAIDLAVEREDAANWGKALYRQAPAERRPAKARFVPYHLWDNRAPGEMLVWMQSHK